MTRAGVYNPEIARMIYDVVSYLKASGFVITKSRRSMQTLQPQEYIYIRNDTGEEIPAFGCVQATGTVEDGGQNYITVDKPADSYGIIGGYLFNSVAPIPDGEYGVAYDGPVVRVLTDSSTITCGDRWGVQINSFEVQPDVGGIIRAIGADDIATDVMRAEILSEPPPVLHFVSPSGGIPARSSLTMGSATCDIYQSSSAGVLSDSGQNKTIYNMASAAFAGSTHGVAALNDAGLWVAIVEDCGA